MIIKKLFIRILGFSFAVFLVTYLRDTFSWRTVGLLFALSTTDFLLDYNKNYRAAKGRTVKYLLVASAYGLMVVPVFSILNVFTLCSVWRKSFWTKYDNELGNPSRLY